MATLTLLRHAKAVAPSSGQQDFDRPLTDRGRRDATNVGSMLAERACDLALVSPARRTAETWQLACAAFKTAPAVELDRRLYLCGARKLVALIQGLTGDYANVLVVGHNPEMHEVAQWLGGRDDSRAARELRHKFPTAALAIFLLDISSWDEIAPARAKLERFAIPAELED